MGMNCSGTLLKSFPVLKEEQISVCLQLPDTGNRKDFFFQIINLIASSGWGVCYWILGIIYKLWSICSLRIFSSVFVVQMSTNGRYITVFSNAMFPTGLMQTFVFPPPIPPQVSRTWKLKQLHENCRTVCVTAEHGCTVKQVPQPLQGPPAESKFNWRCLWLWRTVAAWFSHTLSHVADATGPRH